MSFRKAISYVLFPLSCWYAVGVAIRNMLFALGLKKQEAPHITTIGVGNLSTGGTGKTPMVEYLLSLLADKYPTAMLSRGYKRHSKGYVEDDGTHNAAQLGDEPAMIAAKFPRVRVAVCEKRIEGVQHLMSTPVSLENQDSTDAADAPETPATPQLIILDDVFQHRRIKPSINILLTEYSHPFYNDCILPFGDLREFKSARYRAGIVVVTKCPAQLNPIERHNMQQSLRLLNYQKVFFSYLKYGELQRLEGGMADIDLRRMDGVLAITGIAHPEPMVAELKRSCKVQHLGFADHHDYTKRDVARIREALEAMSGERKVIVTTEKDAMRLRGKCGGLPVYVLPVEVAFHKDRDLDFDQVIESSVGENISFLSKLSIWS